ncbi:unnamed protein product [Thlaspi arvense]|uniref:Uncharacterized protein n=1 Tax=Thlaspi arvense TaxID=13288 RepID=A0AAU9RT72_THLAR|nr:unnamed protein product [Thlaspi arvense]
MGCFIGLRCAKKPKMYHSIFTPKPFKFLLKLWLPIHVLTKWTCATSTTVTVSSSRTLETLKSYIFAVTVSHEETNNVFLFFTPISPS